MFLLRTWLNLVSEPTEGPNASAMAVGKLGRDWGQQSIRHGHIPKVGTFVLFYWWKDAHSSYWVIFCILAYMLVSMWKWKALQMWSELVTQGGITQSTWMNSGLPHLVFLYPAAVGAMILRSLPLSSRLRTYWTGPCIAGGIFFFLNQLSNQGKAQHNLNKG